MAEPTVNLPDTPALSGPAASWAPGESTSGMPGGLKSPELKSLYSLGNDPELLRAMNVLIDKTSSISQISEAQAVLVKYFHKSVHEEIRARG